MRLRLRGQVGVRVGTLALLMLVAITIVSWGQLWDRAELRYGARLVLLMVSERAACERDPASWDWNAEGVDVFAYGRDLASRNPAAPAFDTVLSERLTSDWVAMRWLPMSSPDRGALAVRLPWDGPCNIALSTWRSPAGYGPVGAAGIALFRGFVVSGVIVIIVLLAVGRTVRRLRRLARAIGSAPDGAFAGGTDTGSDEIGDLDRALARACTRLQEASVETERQRRALEELVQHTSHDLATPLTVLAGHFEAIGRAAAAGRPADVKDLNAARDVVRLLHGLGSNLGALARTSAGDLAGAARIGDLRGVVERVVSRSDPMARERVISLEMAVPAETVEVRFDPILVERALANLVDNAISYGRTGGYVAVTLDVRDQRFSLHVVDDGENLDDDTLVNIRTGAGRGDAAKALRPEGSGLGLRIVRAVADAHGFELELTRASDGGLDVELRGPMSGGDSPVETTC